MAVFHEFKKASGILGVHISFSDILPFRTPAILLEDISDERVELL